MSIDLISIVLPIYNGEKYMRESIDSIIMQSYQNWELIIVNDCSIDNTAEIANEYVKKDKRIKYYKNEKNMRLPKTLNKGFSLSKGDYLTWTSDDNLFKQGAFEKMVAALKNNNADFVYASYETIDENGNYIDYVQTNKMGKYEIIGHNVVGACFMYTRKVYDVIGDYEDKFLLVEDYDYWLRIFSKFNITYIKEILYSYRLHDGALTSTERTEKINSACEAAILNNKDNFGKLNNLQKYYLYDGLNRCRQNMLDDRNKYKHKYILYKCYYTLFIKLPYKIKEYGLIGLIKRILYKLVK